MFSYSYFFGQRHFHTKSICTDDFIKYINHSVSDDKPVGIAVAEALNCYEGAKPNFDEGLQELGRFGLMVNYESIISAKLNSLMLRRVYQYLMNIQQQMHKST